MADDSEALEARLAALAGKPSGDPEPARDPVNAPMIRHWCDAIEDRNPVYTDPEFAARSLHGGLVAPPAMLGLDRAAAPARRCARRCAPRRGGLHVGDRHYQRHELRYLAPANVHERLVGVSEKQTALGSAIS
jgi:acyl dehydratase